MINLRNRRTVISSQNYHEFTPRSIWGSSLAYEAPCDSHHFWETTEHSVKLSSESLILIQVPLASGTMQAEGLIEMMLGEDASVQSYCCGMGGRGKPFLGMSHQKLSKSCWLLCWGTLLSKADALVNSQAAPLRGAQDYPACIWQPCSWRSEGGGEQAHLSFGSWGHLQLLNCQSHFPPMCVRLSVPRLKLPCIIAESYFKCIHVLTHS